MTIEASVVFFTVLLIVLMLTSIMHILYEQVRINALAQAAAERGAAIYAVASKDMETGAITSAYHQDENVYWRLINAGNAGRMDRVVEYVEERLNHKKADKNGYDADTIKVTLDNYYIYKRINVEIDVKYHAPFGAFLGMFMEYPYPIHAKGTAAVAEPAEMIRTIDFGYDIIMESEGAANAINKYREALNKLTDMING